MQERNAGIRGLHEGREGSMCIHMGGINECCFGIKKNQVVIQVHEYIAWTDFTSSTSIRADRRDYEVMPSVY